MEFIEQEVKKRGRVLTTTAMFLLWVSAVSLENNSGV